MQQSEPCPATEPASTAENHTRGAGGGWGARTGLAWIGAAILDGGLTHAELRLAALALRDNVRGEARLHVVSAARALGCEPRKLRARARRIARAGGWEVRAAGLYEIHVTLVFWGRPGWGGLVRSVERRLPLGSIPRGRRLGAKGRAALGARADLAEVAAAAADVPATSAGALSHSLHWLCRAVAELSVGLAEARVLLLIASRRHTGAGFASVSHDMAARLGVSDRYLRVTLARAAEAGFLACSRGGVASAGNAGLDARAGISCAPVLPERLEALRDALPADGEARAVFLAEALDRSAKLRPHARFQGGTTGHSPGGTRRHQYSTKKRQSPDPTGDKARARARGHPPKREFCRNFSRALGAIIAIRPEALDEIGIVPARTAAWRRVHARWLPQAGPQHRQANPERSEVQWLSEDVACEIAPLVAALRARGITGAEAAAAVVAGAGRAVSGGMAIEAAANHAAMIRLLARSVWLIGIDPWAGRDMWSEPAMVERVAALTAAAAGRWGTDATAARRALVHAALPSVHADTLTAAEALTRVVECAGHVVKLPARPLSGFAPRVASLSLADARGLQRAAPWLRDDDVALLAGLTDDRLADLSIAGWRLPPAEAHARVLVGTWREGAAATVAAMDVAELTAAERPELPSADAVLRQRAADLDTAAAIEPDAGAAADLRGRAQALRAALDAAELVEVDPTAWAERRAVLVERLAERLELWRTISWRRSEVITACQVVEPPRIPPDAVARLEEARALPADELQAIQAEILEGLSPPLALDCPIVLGGLPLTGADVERATRLLRAGPLDRRSGRRRVVVEPAAVKLELWQIAEGARLAEGAVAVGLPRVKALRRALHQLARRARPHAADAAAMGAAPLERGPLATGHESVWRAAAAGRHVADVAGSWRWAGADPRAAAANVEIGSAHLTHIAARDAVAGARRVGDLCEGAWWSSPARRAAVVGRRIGRRISGNIVTAARRLSDLRETERRIEVLREAAKHQKAALGRMQRPPPRPSQAPAWGAAIAGWRSRQQVPSAQPADQADAPRLITPRINNAAGAAPPRWGR